MILLGTPDWPSQLGVLPPGAHVLVLMPVGAWKLVLLGRRVGLEVRDTMLLLGPTFRFYGVLFRVPLEGTIVENVRKHGTGVLRASADTGRWPTNLAFLHTSECRPRNCFSGCAAAKLDAQSGEKTSGAGAKVRATAAGYAPTAFGKDNRPVGQLRPSYRDSGGASRYYLHFADLDQMVTWLTWFLGETPGEAPASMTPELDRVVPFEDTTPQVFM